MFKLKGKNPLFLLMWVAIAVFVIAAPGSATDMPVPDKAAPVEKGIKFLINDQPVQPEGEVFIEEGTTFIPLRGVPEELGVTVEEILSLEPPTRMVQGHTFIPVRLVAEALGFEVNWIGETKTILIQGTFPKQDDGFEKGEITGETGTGEEIGLSLEEQGLAIPAEKVKEMTLYTLMGDKIKTFSQEEIDEIIGSLNTSPTYTGAYILMLAGNSITITLENDDTVQLTSFGSKDHVVLSGQVDGEAVSACIMSREVGAILLSDVEL